MARFDTSAWLDAGHILQREAARFADAARRELSELENTGGDGGVPGLDQMIAGVLPAVMEAIDPTVAGISENLAAEGGGLIETGESWAEMAAEIEDMDEEGAS